VCVQSALVQAQQHFFQAYTTSTHELFAEFPPAQLVAPVGIDAASRAVVPSALSHIAAGAAETNDGVTVLRVAAVDKLRPFIKVRPLLPNTMCSVPRVEAR
jgi:hypothetical protein